MEETKPIGGKIFTFTFWIASIFVAIAGYFIIKRFIYGLGAVTNMSDGYPWGIWIAYDVVVGTALACGGYAIAIIVYIFNKGEFHPLIRPALITSVFGYSLAGLSIFLDIGRYWNMPNIFLPWHFNVHSVLFEVAICIAAYTLVLWIEVTPAFLEKFNSEKLKTVLNKCLFVFIALGILLPTMHQSSLGTLMQLAGHKLSPLWQSGLLPLLFLISAIFMGYAVVIFESIISATIYRRPIEIKNLGKLSMIMAWIVGAYMVIRFIDIRFKDALSLAFMGGIKGNMFLLENLMILFGLIILAFPENRKHPRRLFNAAFFLMVGGSIYRLNTYLIGFDPGPGWYYFPSVGEIMVTLGIISIEIIGYMWFVKKLPILTGPKTA